MAGFRTLTSRSVVLRHDTDLDNNWLGLGITLVEKTSGRAWASQAELAYWHGYDDGAWSEGDRSRELVFRDLPTQPAQVAATAAAFLSEIRTALDSAHTAP